MGGHGRADGGQSTAHRRHGDPQLTGNGDAGGRGNWVRGAIGAALGVPAIALGARLSVALPAAPVPQSAQTLAVLLVGGLLGPIWGPVSVLLYLVAGACGAPVFADGASGTAVFAGPSGGYLLGFLGAAGYMGWSQGRARGYSQWVLAGVLAHGIVLILGWAWLARSLGPNSAFAAGVAPFLLGGLWKSLAAGMVLAAHDRRRLLRVGPPRPGR